MSRQGYVVAFIGVLIAIIFFTYFTNGPATNEEIKQQKKVVIVGGGAAGIVAALRLAERDPRIEISLFDKEKKLGGNSAKASSGINGCLTTAQKKQNIPDSIDLFYDDVITSGHNKSNTILVKKLVDSSADAISFLESCGINLQELSQCGGHQVPRTHRAEADPTAKMQANIGYTIISNLEKKLRTFPNVKIFTSTPVNELIFEENCVRGVIVNSTQKFFSDFVILASGGYGRDARLLKEFAPESSNLPSTNGDWTTGDAIHFSRKIGAGLTLMDQVQIHPTGIIDPKNPNATNKFLAAEAIRAVGGILVNSRAKRFVNELGLRDYVTQSIFDQKDSYGGQAFSYLLLNQQAIDKFGPQLMKFYISKGFVIQFNNAAEFCQQYELDQQALRETFTQYNAAKDGSVLDPFGKDRFPVAFNWDENIFVMFITPSIHYTMGGLLIDEHARVLTAGKDPIVGLLAAGEVTGGVHGNNRLAGNSLLECVVFGTVAAQTVLNKI